MIIKHYQVVLPEDTMDAVKAKSGKDTTNEAITAAIEAYIAEPRAVDIAQKRRK